MILAIHPEIFEDKLLTRIRSVCDANFILSIERQANKLVKVLEVRKVHNAEQSTDNVFNFEVLPNVGLQVLHISTFKI